jgi:hypothetical protein
VNYAPATPVREGIRSSFADGVIGAVHRRIDVPPIRRAIPATLHAPPTEGRDDRITVDGQRVRVQRLAGGALLGDRALDAYQFGVVGPQRTAARMGHRDAVLLAPPAPVRFRCAERVLADAPRAEALSDQQSAEAAAGGGSS